MLKRLYVRTEEDLVSHEVDNVPYASDVALYSIEAKLCCKDVKVSSVLRGIIGDGIAEALSEVVVVQNRH
jgi:hypothetical protein